MFQSTKSDSFLYVLYEGSARKQSKTHWKTNILRIRILKRFGADLEMFKNAVIPALSVREIRVGPDVNVNFPGKGCKKL